MSFSPALRSIAPFRSAFNSAEAAGGFPALNPPANILLQTGNAGRYDNYIEDLSLSNTYLAKLSGRYSIIDGVGEYMVVGDLTGYTGDTTLDRIDVRVRTAAASTTIWAQVSDTVGYSGTSTLAGLWETVSIDLSSEAVADCSNVYIGYSTNDASYTAADIAWVEIIDSSGATVCKHYNAVSSDATASGLNNVVYPDISGNGFHGYFVGGEGATAEGAYPYISGAALDTRMWLKESGSNYITFGTTFCVANVYATFKIVLDTPIGNNAFVLFRDESTSARFSIVAQSGSGTSGLGTAGGTLTIDGVSVTTRSSIWNALADGLEHTCVLSNVDWSTFTGGLRIWGYGSTFDGGGSITEMQIDIGNTGTDDHAYQPDGTTSAAWTDTIGSANGTLNGSAITLGNRRATIPQLAGLNYNEYQRFDGNVANYVTAPAAVTSYPYTLECKIITKMTSVGAFLSISDASTSNNTAFLGTTAPGYTQLTIEDSGGATSIIGSTTLINDGFPHTVKGVFTSATDRELFVDGVSQGTSAVSRTPTGLDTFGVGCKFDATPSAPFTGIVYDAVLSDGTNDKQKLLGYGPDPWKDTYGLNDGSVTGTLLDNLVLEDEASAGSDSYGNALAFSDVNLYRRFNGTDTYVNTGVLIADPDNFTLSFNVVALYATGTTHTIYCGVDESNGTTSALLHVYMDFTTTAAKVTLRIRNDAGTNQVFTTASNVFTIDEDEHTVDIANVAGSWSITVDDVLKASGSYTPASTFATMDWGAIGAKNVTGTISDWHNGLVTDFLVEGVRQFRCYGPYPWVHLDGGTDGTESGTFGDFYGALDTGTTDVYGNTLIDQYKEIKPINQVINLVGDGDSIYSPDDTVYDTVKTVAFFHLHDGVTKDIFDFGTPVIGTTTTAATSTGLTSPSYFVDGASGTTITANQWNCIVVADTTAISTDSLSILQRVGHVKFDTNEWTVADALAYYNQYKSQYNL